MYIEAKRRKKKYVLYLVHSKREDGKSKKLINQYLCSIDRDEIEGANSDELAVIIADIRGDMQRNLNKIPETIRFQLAGKSRPLYELIFNKLEQLAKIEE